MDDKQLRDLLKPTAPAEPDSQTTAAEEVLWKKLAEELDNEKIHREYVGFVLKKNLVKTALRRYGEVIDAKDRYSIETRRLTKKYQKSLVDVLFFTPRLEEQQKTSSLELFGILITALALITGFYMLWVKSDIVPPSVMLILRLLFPISLIVLIVLIRRKVQKAKAMIKRSETR